MPTQAELKRAAEVIAECRGSEADDDIRIDKGVPIPQRVYKRRGPVTVAVQKMKVGDSIWLTPYKPSLLATAHTLARRLGMKVTVRHLVERGIEGVRVWRIK